MLKMDSNDFHIFANDKANFKPDVILKKITFLRKYERDDWQLEIYFASLKMTSI